MNNSTIDYMLKKLYMTKRPTDRHASVGPDTVIAEQNYLLDRAGVQPYDGITSEEAASKIQDLRTQPIQTAENFSEGLQSLLGPNSPLKPDGRE